MNVPHVCPVTRATCDEAIRPTRRQVLRCYITQAQAAHMHSCPIRAIPIQPARPNAYTFGEIKEATHGL